MPGTVKVIPPSYYFRYSPCCMLCDDHSFRIRFTNDILWDDGMMVLSFTISGLLTEKLSKRTIHSCSQTHLFFRHPSRENAHCRNVERFSTIWQWNHDWVGLIFFIDWHGRRAKLFKSRDKNTKPIDSEEGEKIRQTSEAINVRSQSGLVWVSRWDLDMRGRISMNDIISLPVSRKLVWYQLQGYLVISWELLTASRHFDQLSYIKYQGDCLHPINTRWSLWSLYSKSFSSVEG